MKQLNDFVILYQHQHFSWSSFRFSIFLLNKGTPYAFDKKTPKFAQGLDFLRFLMEKTKEIKGKH